jgi:hypothetical protein
MRLRDRHPAVCRPDSFNLRHPLCDWDAECNHIVIHFSAEQQPISEPLLYEASHNNYSVKLESLKADD